MQDCRKLCEMFAFAAENHAEYTADNTRADYEQYWRMVNKNSDTKDTILGQINEILRAEAVSDYKVKTNMSSAGKAQFLYYAILKNTNNNLSSSLNTSEDGRKEFEISKPSASKDEARYVVYLVDHFDKKVYLTFNQGTQNRELSDIDEEAKKLREMLKPYFGEENLVWDSFPGEKYSANKKYGEKYSKGTVCYIQYDVDTLSSMKDDTKLIEDLKLFIKISDKYFELKK